MAEYHEAFWVTCGTAAPVIALALVVSLGSAMRAAGDVIRKRRAASRARAGAKAVVDRLAGEVESAGRPRPERNAATRLKIIALRDAAEQLTRRVNEAEEKIESAARPTARRLTRAFIVEMATVLGVLLTAFSFGASLAALADERDVVAPAVVELTLLAAIPCVLAPIPVLLEAHRAARQWDELESDLGN